MTQQIELSVRNSRDFAVYSNNTGNDADSRRGIFNSRVQAAAQKGYIHNPTGNEITASYERQLMFRNKKDAENKIANNQQIQYDCEDPKKNGIFANNANIRKIIKTLDPTFYNRMNAGAGLGTKQPISAAYKGTADLSDIIYYEDIEKFVEVEELGGLVPSKGFATQIIPTSNNTSDYVIDPRSGASFNTVGVTVNDIEINYQTYGLTKGYNMLQHEILNNGNEVTRQIGVEAAINKAILAEARKITETSLWYGHGGGHKGLLQGAHIVDIQPTLASELGQLKPISAMTPSEVSDWAARMTAIIKKYFMFYGAEFVLTVGAIFEGGNVSTKNDFTILPSNIEYAMKAVDESLKLANSQASFKIAQSIYLDKEQQIRSKFATSATAKNYYTLHSRSEFKFGLNPLKEIGVTQYAPATVMKFQNYVMQTGEPYSKYQNSNNNVGNVFRWYL